MDKQTISSTNLLSTHIKSNNVTEKKKSDLLHLDLLDLESSKYLGSIWAMIYEKNLGSYTRLDGVDLGLYISMSFSPMNLRVSISRGEILSSEA